MTKWIAITLILTSSLLLSLCSAERAWHIFKAHEQSWVEQYAE